MKWNLPNVLTVARISVLPLILWLIWPGIETRETCFWAGVVYAFAGAMDMVDGAVARHTNQVTVLGKFLDPLADKLFYLVTLIGLLALPGMRVPPWLVMVALIRELTITGLRGIAVSEGIVIAASEGGKAKTALGTVGMVALLFHYPYVLDFGIATPYVETHRVGLWITYLSLAFSLSSGFGYVRGFLKATRHQTRHA